MPDCHFCGRSAGLFSSVHSECQRAYDEGKRQLVAAIGAAVVGTSDLSTVRSETEGMARRIHLPFHEVDDVLAEAWFLALHCFVTEGILTPEQENRLKGAASTLNLKRDDLLKRNVPHIIEMARALRAITEGNLLAPPGGDRALPFVLQKGEEIAWVFEHVHRYEETTHREYVSGSAGISVRVARGLYYRTSGSRGHSVQTVSMDLKDTRMLGFGTKNVYFSSPSKSLRIPYSKIVAFHPFEDGVGISRDGVNSKQENFATGDGWFVFNLASNLARNGQ